LFVKLSKFCKKTKQSFRFCRTKSRGKLRNVFSNNFVSHARHSSAVAKLHDCDTAAPVKAEALVAIAAEWFAIASL
jgi:hypothetical protein